MKKTSHCEEDYDMHRHHEPLRRGPGEAHTHTHLAASDVDWRVADSVRQVEEGVIVFDEAGSVVVQWQLKGPEKD